MVLVDDAIARLDPECGRMRERIGVVEDRRDEGMRLGPDDRGREQQDRDEREATPFHRRSPHDPVQAGHYRVTGSQARRRFLHEALAHRARWQRRGGRAAAVAADAIVHRDGAATERHHWCPIEPGRHICRAESRAQIVDFLRLEHEVRVVAVRGEPLDRAIEPGRVADVPPHGQPAGVVADAAAMLRGNDDVVRSGQRLHGSRDLDVLRLSARRPRTRRAEPPA